MTGKPQRKDDSKKRLDPAILVALIGLVGTIIAALLASPLLEKWLSASPTATDTAAPASNEISVTTLTSGNRIELNQTVTGKLYFNEPGTWIFSQGPATVTIVLDMGPDSAALIILHDPSGKQLEYVEQQSPGIVRLVNYMIPAAGDYKILVRNLANEPADYILTLQDVLTPPPP